MSNLEDLNNILQKNAEKRHALVKYFMTKLRDFDTINPMNEEVLSMLGDINEMYELTSIGSVRESESLQDIDNRIERILEIRAKLNSLFP